jgi:apolipoprotein D and lipocalin family protein
VRFAPAWLSWLPIVWGDYRVLALDQAYTSALIGERSRQFLWILSRTPTLAQTRVDELLEEAERQGFPIDRIDFTLQDEP